MNFNDVLVNLHYTTIFLTPCKIDLNFRTKATNQKVYFNYTILWSVFFHEF